MNVQDQHLPQDWLRLNIPNLYSYKDFIVRQIDHHGDRVELVTYGFEGKYYRVLNIDLISAMKEMEMKLKGKTIIPDPD